MTIRQVLTGHESPETAYVVDDYPYGFKLRCKIRYWIETKGKNGQRMMTQTTNPKAAGERWNKPKASTYSDLRVLYIEDETGHVQGAALSIEYDADKLEDFVAKYGEALTSPYAVTAIKFGRYLHLTRTHMERLAGGNIYDVPDVDKRKEIVIESKRLAVEDLKRLYPENGEEVKTIQE